MWGFDSSVAIVGQYGLLLCHALAELFQEAMTALQDIQDEFSTVGGRDHFHRRQPRAGTCDVQAQHLGIISEHAARLAPARDADVKLLLIDRRQRA
jgi:hypothetical protein